MLLNRERANEIMDQESLDALVACTPNNVRYLSGFDSDFLYDVPWVAAAILPRSENIAPTLVVNEVEIAVLVESPSWMPDVRTYFFEVYDGILPIHTLGDANAYDDDDRAIANMVESLRGKGTRSVVGGVVDALRETGLSKGRLGFDDIRFAAALGDVIGGAQTVDATNTFLEIRMVKTADEIAIMRDAAKRNELAFQRALRAVGPGVTWQELFTAYEVGTVEQEARPFGTYNGAGRKSAGGARPNRRYEIQRGDMICFDCMLKYRRYIGDMQRTVVIGEASDKLERYWHAIKMGVDEAYGRMRAGVSTDSLRKDARETIRKSGIPDFEVAFIHGLGLDHIEIPCVAGGHLGVFDLEPGMVINMDVEVHEIGFGGVFFEESMLITKTGAERFYTLPREMIRV